jgi:hypothetical protein
MEKIAANASIAWSRDVGRGLRAAARPASEPARASGHDAPAEA